MVFSTHPLYQLDPPDWQYHQQQQQMILYGVGNEISNSNTTPQHLPLNHQPPAATGGSRSIRHGSMTDRARMAKVPLPETSLKCPRCESTNTKFCYFNNYSLTQPRHFCKTCRRYWTRGGALRNVPVGGGCRRATTTKRKNNKRSKSQDVSSNTITLTTTTTSTDHQNGNNNNMIDDGVPQFPLYSNNGLNQMVHEFSDNHYISGVVNNNYGGSYTDPHIAKLFQTGVISTSSSSERVVQMHSLPFPFLNNFSHQEHYPSHPCGVLGYQFNQCGGQLSSNNNIGMSTMDQNVATQFTNVKTEDEERGLKRFLEMRALEISHTSMASGNGHTWTDVLGFTSNEQT